MAWLQPVLAALGWLLSKLTFGWLVYRQGKLSVYRKAADAAIRAKDRQLKAAIDAPRTKDELLDRVRKSGLCLALAFLLAGCASQPYQACPPVREYDEAFTQAFIAELTALPPEYPTLTEALSDYYVLRQMAKICGD